MVGGKRLWIFTRHENIYVYIPNLIGYFRIASTLTSFSVAWTRPVTCVLFYLIGFVCDELDGRFARLFDQTSQFGAVLDMITDRLSTSGLLVILCMMYRERYVLFLWLLFLDISSHWAHMYYTLTSGSSTHKDIKSKSWLVRTYYQYRVFMGFCCVSCEALYLLLYLLHGTPQKSSYHIILVILAALSIPGFVSKQVINVFQLRNAISGLVLAELKNR